MQCTDFIILIFSENLNFGLKIPWLALCGHGLVPAAETEGYAAQISAPGALDDAVANDRATFVSPVL